jgi:rod shape-determining protein MreD
VGRTSISNYLAFLVLLVLATLQSSLGHFFSVSGVHPDLVLVAVIGWTVLRGPFEGLVWAVAGGLCLDLLSGGPFGAVIVPLVVASLLAFPAHGRVLGGYTILPLALAFPLSVVFYLLHMLILNLVGVPITWGMTLTQVVLPASLLNIAAMLVLLPALHWIERHTGGETIEW